MLFAGSGVMNISTIISNTTWLQWAMLLLAPLAVIHWRRGVYWISAWEILRDPMRKITGESPVFLAVFGCTLWLALASVSLYYGPPPRESLRRVPWHIGLAAMLFAAFLGIGLIVGVQNGVSRIILAMGLCSYGSLIPGFIVAMQLRWTPGEVRRWFWFVLILNAIVLPASVVEAAGIKCVLLGGISMEWYRVRGGIHIPLPSGIFRSPDILGYHAATAFALAAILRLTTNVERIRTWLNVFVLAMLALLIFVARRKMMGFAIVFGGFLLLYSKEFRNRLRPALRSALVHSPPLRYIGVVFAIAILAPIPQIQYALSTLIELPHRLLVSLFYAPVTTVLQNGFWGVGLGIGTQGNYHVAVKNPAAWQEDGISRLFLECGVPGAICCLLGMLVVGMFVNSRLTSPCHMALPEHCRALTVGIAAIIVANACTFAISHQHLSGDPVATGLVGLLFGLFLNLTTPTMKGASAEV